MRVQLLGPVGVWVDGVSVGVGGPKQRAVLAVLCVDPGRVVSTDRLVGAVWGDGAPERAARSVSTYVSNLRSVMGDVVGREGGGYVARLGRGVVDVAVFEDLVAAGEYRAALEVWPVGLPFEGVDGHDVLAPEVSRLVELRVSAVESAIEGDIEAGAAAGVVAEVERLALEYPGRERVVGLRMRALYGVGRQTDALRVYREHRETLASQHGLEPSPDLQALELQILQHDLSSSGGATDAPPASTLPARYSSFVGRTEDLSDVGDRLDANRLVSLIGPGGIGKSSLAHEVVASRALAAGTDLAYLAVETIGSGELAEAVAVSVGLRPGPGTDPLTVLVTYAADRRMLFLLDGCEPHIDEVAALVDRVLSACPGVSVLATSREPLGLAGESVIRVGGLSPDHAAQLFAERAGMDLGALDEAQRAKVDDVVSAVDFVPLAIELAAARSRTIPIDQLVDRLDDQVRLLRQSRTFDTRHGSLATALQWSYDLLAASEQRAFRRYAVFEAGFPASSADVVLGGPDAVDQVGRLVEVSLLQPPDMTGTYRMLEPVRQYARFLLESSGEAEVAKERHASWFAQQAEQAWVRLFSVAGTDTAQWISRSRFDVKAALEWCAESGNPDPGVEILAHLGRAYGNSGQSRVLLPVAPEVVLHTEATPSPFLPWAMANTAHMLHISQRDAEAMDVLERAESIARSLDDTTPLGRVLARKAALIAEEVDRDPAWSGRERSDALEARSREVLALLTEGLELMKATSPPDYHLDVRNLAWLYARRGDFELAEEQLDIYEGWSRALGGLEVGMLYDDRARMAAARGDLDRAKDLMHEALPELEASAAIVFARAGWNFLSLVETYREAATNAVEAWDNVHRIDLIIGDEGVEGAAGEMRVLALDGQHDRVLSRAGAWFGRAARGEALTEWGWPRYTPEFVGSAVEEPPLLLILLPVAMALCETGQTEAALAIAQMMPDLIDQSQYRGWVEIGETNRWERLVERCGGGELEPRRLSYEEAIADVARLLGAV